MSCYYESTSLYGHNLNLPLVVMRVLTESLLVGEIKLHMYTILNGLLFIRVCCLLFEYKTLLLDIFWIDQCMSWEILSYDFPLWSLTNGIAYFESYKYLPHWRVVIKTNMEWLWNHGCLSCNFKDTPAYQRYSSQWL